MIRDLRLAVAARNAPGQVAAAHSLKGSSLYLGARQVANLSATLEQAGRQGQVASPEQLQELEQTFARTEEAFQQLSR
jgi:HPt (histidine-containing phosphotransfer) domain-containing protein